MPTTPAGRVAVIDELFENNLVNTEQARRLLTDEQTFEGLSEPEPPSQFDDGTRPSPPDTDSGQYGATGSGDYFFAVPTGSGIEVDNGIVSYQRAGDTLNVTTQYRAGYYGIASEESKLVKLEARVQELEEQLKNIKAFYEDMVDEELGVANDDSSGS